ncbi:ABC transporter permease [Legionella jamestowniensis]|uniref:Peptide ABC transporter permease n=1 Tax=Legionella jamestowniensis TaxID=455 RepID=A0A0W0UGI8_9GAMM|nr:ABC transporter permease [Legionella jamestowniensis]KTD06749.1 peptide ABC transporter permease [Legionella jamestowniensis]OCH97208.1 peptide ABC transporter permease [Legionella jamestowniensis]SFL83802.1 peptide/nickel transport system permease protein [Legionella jamestowniensis DSM 19215]
MEFLWTDKCFLAVLLVSLVITLFSLRKQHIRVAFARIGKKPLAMSAGVVLLFFLTIGILDSIHLNSGNAPLGQNDSILDRLLAPLGATYEKTYSAPLALKLYSVETVLIDDKVKQLYPRLNYVSQTVKNNQDKHQMISAILVKALLMAVVLIGLLWLVIVVSKGFLTKTLQVAPGKSGLSILLTSFICFFIVLASYWLSRHFHLLGTGKIGQDIFYYTVKSIRTGLVIGILTTLFMLPLALIFGISAGYFGGLIDDIIQYIYTTLSSIPGVLLITASVLSMQTYIANHPEQFTTLAQSADARLFALCLILGVTSWTSLCRLLRAETLKLREVDYVTAGRALGSSALTIIRKHLLPNVMHIVLITLVLDFSFLVLAEAVLSYVGVGVSPMTISWGNMINGARLELAREPIVWWPMMSAFVFMFILVLASNLFADAVRDAFDPHQV